MYSATASAWYMMGSAGVAGDESVDLSKGKPGIFDGVEGDLHAELTEAFIRHDTHVALGHAD